MKTAYTVVSDYEGPHLDVGPTFESEAAAESYVGGSERNTVLTVVSWVDDFTEHDRARFLFRTDGIHEVSYVVAAEETDEIAYLNEASVGTTLVSNASLNNQNE